MIQRYRKALDTAVKIATVYNVQPIKGKSIVLCDIGLNMDVNCTSARGLGKAIKVLIFFLVNTGKCVYYLTDLNYIFYLQITKSILVSSSLFLFLCFIFKYFGV